MLAAEGVLNFCMRGWSAYPVVMVSVMLYNAKLGVK